MADPRFHRRVGPIALGELAVRSGLFAVPDGVDPATPVEDVAPLERAGPGELSFLENRKYLPALEATRAGFCVVAAELVARVPAGTVALATPHPYLAYALIVQAFYPPARPPAGVHASAVLGEGVRLGEDVAIGPCAVIGDGAEIGARTVIGSNVTIGPGVVLGADCRIGANASLETCLVGERVHVQSGARIGTAGFGFAPHPERHRAVPQIGRAIIGDDCHVGANACIACGSGHDTVLGRNVWIDNLVQLAHNVEIGDGSILVGQVGLAGSTRVGRYVQMGGQAGLAGHLTIGDGVRIGAKAGVMNDIAAGETVIGQPAVPEKDFWRQVIAVRRLIAKRGKRT